MSNVSIDKKKFRDDVKKNLNNLDQRQYEALNIDLSKNVSLFFQTHHIIQKVVGVFSPIQKEPIWYLSLDEEENVFSFPIEVNGLMVFIKSSWSELEERTEFGVNLKVPKKNGEVASPDLILIPGLAFSKNGKRLGRGKGYFDRYLENFKGLRIGIGFECQLFEEVPTDEHDEKLNWLITEKNIYKF